MSTHPTHAQRARELAEEYATREADLSAEIMFGNEPTLDARKGRINQQGYLSQDLAIFAAYAVGLGGRDCDPEGVRIAHTACYGAGFPELTDVEVETVLEMMGRSTVVIDGTEHTV